ncbi:MAG: polyhydroxyalkanoate depolymerase [Acidimicrobiales bacterium]
MLYQAYQAHRDLTLPAVSFAELSNRWLDAAPDWWVDSPWGRVARAGTELLARTRLQHQRPAWGVNASDPEVVVTRPFASLVHFAGEEAPRPRPRVLVVTALAGHFSTLLRPTVRSLLADHDVYATDWRNGRDVPLDEGPFGFDDYVADVIAFLEHVGPGAHVIAVCQPCPAVLAAVSVMAASGHPAQPRSVTLMAGPVDTRVNQTAINLAARARPLRWFEDNLVTTVPRRYAGAGRRVYPGFLQLAGFVSLDVERHTTQHLHLWHHLVRGERDAAVEIEDFYDEYSAVLDMAAEFYLDTLDAVFQRDLLARGRLTWRGERVEPAAISGTALLTVEGDHDEICTPGQTAAAHDLCRGIPASRKHHHLASGVGHYGVFAGSRWERDVYPVVRDLIARNS